MTAAAVPAQTPRELSPRMRLLLDSAVTVVAQQGMRGLTHRAIDREAGLPEGSCSAYMRTRAALVQSLATHVNALLRDDLETLVQEAAGSVDFDPAVDAACRLVTGWVVERRELMLTRAELFLELARRPDMAEGLERWREDLIGVVVGIYAAREHQQPRPLAAVVVAAIEGVIIAALGNPAMAEPEALDGTIRMIITRLGEQT